LKDKWYADKRDLIKWGGIVHLCKTRGINHVIQAAYFRESTWPQLNFGYKDTPIPGDVIAHFRDIEDIKRLGKKTGLNIEVVKGGFTQRSREAYTANLCKRIRDYTQRLILFLDPDTGVAPKNAKAEHIKPEEINLIWHALKPKDVLVLYQHSFREADWQQIRKEQLAESCNLDKNRIGEWSAPKIAHDVVFFFCEK